MNEGPPEFRRQLIELGYDSEPREDGRVVLPYTVRAGRHAGKQLRLGFEVPCDFPRTPPSGPHFAPRLQTINPGAPNHPDRAHESSFGSDWQYWSRPYPGWRGTETVATYLAYVDRLLETA